MPPPPLATEHTPCAVIVGVGDIDGIGGALCRRSVQGGLPTCVVKFIPLHTPAVTMSINAILADLAAKNRPGAGFVPTGSPAAGPV